jgi:hypothetical protein
MYAAGLMMFVVSATATLNAGVVAAVPEIGGGSLITGLGLLAGGVMVLRARFGRR